VIGRDDMNSDPKFKTNADRVANRAEVDDIVGEWIRSRTMDEVLEVFRQEGITGGPIYDISQIVADPHFKEREIIVNLPDAELGTVPMHNIFPKLSVTPGMFRSAAPDLGQDNDDILGAAGIDAATLIDLKSRGII
jgi:crotonobetainyl-CoA:carnitine CoA-transferase CaiB-like acyl-CoA transferase